MNPVDCKGLSGIIPTPTTTAVEASEETSVDQRSVSKRMTDFGFKWYREAVKTEEGNILLSPFSAFFALSMLYAGANGNTQLEMKQALDLPEIDKELHSFCSKYMSELTSGDMLEIASGLFPKSGLAMNARLYQGYV